ncbi:hypothetical protein [Aureispira anguillae]|uniref:Uncharacterized protein n=1 Tax=Aureispira anguillae TaxID=2864201 RepID=A0A915YE77_9BACT|nr:hypothetical protein [Aureispira anguillae]BDS11483.1 hypothetical protein AsAng_0021970 [Aureispira anguillae]
MKRDKKLLSLTAQLKKLKLFIILASLTAQKRATYLIRPEQDFTRHRKLDFATTVGLILGLLKKV